MLALAVSEGFAPLQERDPDPGAKGYYEQAVAALAGTEPVLAKSSRHGVVLNCDRHTEAGPEGGAEVEVSEGGKGIPISYDARRELHRPAGTDTDAHQAMSGHGPPRPLRQPAYAFTFRTATQVAGGYLCLMERGGRGARNQPGTGRTEVDAYYNFFFSCRPPWSRLSVCQRAPFRVRPPCGSQLRTTGYGSRAEAWRSNAGPPLGPGRDNTALGPSPTAQPSRSAPEAVSSRPLNL